MVLREPSGSRHLGVVVVEDSRSDALLILEGLKGEGFAPDVLLLSNGEEASNHFEDQEEANLVPGGGLDLILMDLNLPKKSGAQLIGEIKAIPALKNVPLVIFSGSDPQEVWRCYDLGANLVVPKPHDAPSFINAVKGIKRYYIDLMNGKEAPGSDLERRLRNPR